MPRPAAVALVASLSLSLSLLSTSSACAVAVALGLGAERGRAGLVVEHVALPDGHELALLERVPRSRYLHDDGTPVAPPVVMLHGSGGNKDHFTRLAQQLPAELWLIAPDLPPQGGSTFAASASYDSESQAERVYALLQHKGIARAHVIGNSLGGEVAAILALRHPDVVASLVLLAPAGIPSPTPPKVPVSTAIHTVEDFDKLLAASFVKPPVLPGFLKQHFVDIAVERAAQTEKVLADRKLHPTHLVDDAGRITPPTLIVWGDSDGVLDPSAGPLWAERMPSADLVVLRRTGHAPQVERPSETAQLVLAWWQRRGILPR